MIGKIKELMDVKKDIKILAKSVTGLDSQLSALSGRMDQFGKRFDDLLSNTEKGMRAMETQLREHQQRLAESADRLKEEVYDFKLLKSGLKDRILGVFKEELHQEILKNLELLRGDTVRYQKARDEVSGLSHRIGEASSDLRRFTDVATKLKKEDFNMVNYARRLESMEEQKARLRKQVDDLQRMIGKMRRRS
ncbi:MAG: hypothetical protein GXP63_04325 [DPANN group archaeon]|nr:hypothetical protein [DPANN group archaeon]